MLAKLSFERHSSCTNGWRIRLEEVERLVSSIKIVLNEAIEHGGSTVKDFKGADGMRDDFKPGSLSMIEADNRAENAELILKQNSSMVDRRTGVQFANLHWSAFKPTSGKIDRTRRAR
jgi:hypothetical protein